MQPLPQHTDPEAQGAPLVPQFRQHWVLLLQQLVPAEQYEPLLQHTDPVGMHLPLQDTSVPEHPLNGFEPVQADATVPSRTLKPIRSASRRDDAVASCRARLSKKLSIRLHGAFKQAGDRDSTHGNWAADSTIRTYQDGTRSAMHSVSFGDLPLPLEQDVLQGIR